MLARLGPRDLASLAGAGRACAAAVAATALMQRAKDETDPPPAAALHIPVPLSHPLLVCPCDVLTTHCRAARGGHLATLRWVWEHHCPLDKDEVRAEAAH